ncbi:MAG: hypothetical protein JKY08_11935 [Flavobacteriaceae bacterium]|nr:hypothetical protein [Flavobacteriaceae bacterium]
MKKLLVLLAIIVSVGTTYGQEKSKESRFMVRGYGSASYISLDSADEHDSGSSFNMGTFAPIFLFKASDKLMFEAELEFEYEHGEFEIMLEYANLSYILNDYMTVRAGKFILPFGTFGERLHPSWINKLASMPLGFGHGAVSPSSGVGAEVRGAFDFKGSKINYALYATNGPKLKTDAHGAGMLEFGLTDDNNKNKAIGGRLGYLPFSDSSLELGFSFMNATVGDAHTDYEDTKANLFAYDLSYVKKINPLGGVIDIKAQYNQSTVDDRTYEIHDENDVPSDLVINDNKSTAYYAQLSYKPTMSNNDFIKNLEFVGRMSKVETPDASPETSDLESTTFGINYWLSWRSAIKVNYQLIDGIGGHGAVDDKVFTIQWVIGL